MLGLDLELLKQAALRCGEIAKKHFQNNPENWEKAGDQGPVSVADLEVNAMLEDTLRNARPDYGWLSEETGDNAERLEKKRVFIIDPIDGTRSFIAGHENFSHSLAIAEDGKITDAVVFLPIKDMLFEASLGQGARMNGAPICHSRQTEISGARVLAASNQLKPEHWPNGVPPIKREFRSSLAYRLCIVANGRFDGMLTARPAWEWDVAAGDLICREAGAHVTTFTGEETTYNNAKPLINGIISAPPAVSKALLAHAVE